MAQNKVLLVNTPQIEEMHYPLARVKDSCKSQPFELALLSSHLRREGLDTLVLDSNASCNSFGEFISELEGVGFEPDHIIFNSIYFDRYWLPPLNLNNALRTGQILEDMFPKSQRIFIGPHNNLFSSRSQEVIASDRIGSDFGKAAELITGVYSDKSAVLQNVPDYSDLDLSKYSDMILKGDNFYLLASSLGCNFSCIFCTKPFGNTDYMRLDVFEKTIDGLVDNPKILFHDDNLTTNKKRLREILPILSEKNAKWRCLSRISTVDEELLSEMRAAGCGGISYGLESVVQASLDFYKKKSSVEKARRIIRYTRDLGITMENFMLVGNPNETEEDLENINNFIGKLGLKKNEWSMFMPIPYSTTKLGEMAGKPEGEEEIVKLTGTVGNNLTQRKIISKIREAEALYYHAEQNDALAAFGIDLKITPDDKIYLIEINGARVGAGAMKGLYGKNPNDEIIASIQKDFDLPIEVFGTHHGMEASKLLPTFTDEDALKMGYLRGSENRSGSGRKILWNFYGEKLDIDEKRFMVMNPQNIEKASYSKSVQHDLLEDLACYPRSWSKGSFRDYNEMIESPYLIIKIPDLDHGLGIKVVSPSEFGGAFDPAEIREKYSVLPDYIIQEFVPNRLVRSSKTGGLHEACMRLVVLVKKVGGEVKVEEFGGYWRLASEPWDSDGSIENRVIANFDRNGLAERITDKDRKLASEFTQQHYPIIYQRLSEVE